MYDYSKLTGKIIEVFGTRREFARALGLSEHSVSVKLKGFSSWKDRDISKAAEILGVELSEIPNYFFKPKVQMSGTELHQTQDPPT